MFGAHAASQIKIRILDMADVNTAVFLWLNATATSPVWLVPLALFVSQELPHLLVAGAVGAFLVGNSRVKRCLLRVLLAMLAAWLLARVGQYLWPMPRPFSLGLGTAWLAHANSAAFPSTHASVAFAFAGAVAMYTRCLMVVASALGLASLVAWSRVSLGVHFPVDVLAGALVGGASAWLAGKMPASIPRIQPAL